MSTKTVLEEQLHKLEKEIKADEAWIEYIDQKVHGLSDESVSLSARLDETDAKLEDSLRILKSLGRTLDALRS